MTPIAYSPTETYVLELQGPDLAHLLHLIDNSDRFCTKACPRCERISEALGNAEPTGDEVGVL